MEFMKQYFCLIVLFFLTYQSYSQENFFSLPSAAPTAVRHILQGGHPGPASAIRIRCARSIDSDNTPLFVVDGILYEPSNASQIKPADIIEIQVLKTPLAETIYGCRALHGVVIITTKKAYHRKFTIRDAKSMLAVGNATIEAKSAATGKVSYFVADAFGRFETDSLKTNDYDLTISSTGYKTGKLSLKSVLQNKGDIKLEPVFIELEELVVTGRVIRCGRMISTCYHQEKHCGLFICGVRGVKIQKQKQKPEMILHATTSFQVYPNPVSSSSTINISFPNLIPGEYQIRILNSTGQLFYSVQKQISGKGETEQIYLNDKIMPGMYIVQVTDEQKKLLQSRKIVVQ
jgi:hypothetical protein